LADPAAALGIQLAKAVVGQGSGPFDPGDAMDEGQGHGLLAQPEHLAGPLCLGSPVAISRNGHLAKAVGFGAESLINHERKE